MWSVLPFITLDVRIRNGETKTYQLKGSVLVVNGNIFRGSKSGILLLVSILRVWVNCYKKERICCRKYKFFPLRVDLIFEGLGHPVRHMRGCKSRKH